MLGSGQKKTNGRTSGIGGKACWFGATGQRCKMFLFPNPKNKSGAHSVNNSGT